MVPNEFPSVSVCRRGSEDPGSDPRRTVVWVRGDHEYATREHLSNTFAHAARLDDADLIVDLRGVTFMDASTIGAVVGAYNGLRARSRSLCVREPSPLARRLFDVCELAFLIDSDPAPPRSPVAPALNSWIAVPTSERASAPAQSPVTGEAPSGEPARAPAVPAGSQHRAGTSR